MHFGADITNLVTRNSVPPETTSPIARAWSALGPTPLLVPEGSLSGRESGYGAARLMAIEETVS